MGEQGTPEVSPETSPEISPERAFEKARLAEETRNERKMWYFLAYFLFGIHLVAFVMIYAVMHAK